MIGHLSDEELVDLLLETVFQLGTYSMMTDPGRLYDTKPALEAREKMRGDLLGRLRARAAGEPDPEQAFAPRGLRDPEEVTARDALMALIPAIWRATERASSRSRAAAFGLITRFNTVLRPLGFEYLLRPGSMIILRRAKKRWTWADETR